MLNGQHTKYSVLDVKNKKSLNHNLYFIACFPKFLQTSHQFRLIISYINLKYTFNIPFRITLKTIIMGTSSQFHDGAQLKFYPHFRSEILHVWIKFKKPLSRSGSSLLNNNGNLQCNSTNFLRLTLSNMVKLLVYLQHHLLTNPWC